MKTNDAWHAHVADGPCDRNYLLYVGLCVLLNFVGGLYFFAVEEDLLLFRKYFTKGNISST
jgi:hypothetical protein